VKALFLSPIDPHRLRGGGERSAAELWRALSRAGDVACATAADLAGLDLAAYDVVHVAGPSMALVERVRRARRPKLVVTFHGAPLGLIGLGWRTGRGGVFRVGQAIVHAGRLVRTTAVIRAADALAAVSRATALALGRQWPPARPKIAVIENGVDTERFTPEGSRDGGYALYVGRLERSKGVDRLVRAFRDRSRPLVVAGEGSLRAELEAAASPAVHFAGAVSDVELIDLYRGASLCVFPSLYEGFGLVALEALACGTPAAVSEAFGVGAPAADLLAWFPVADDAGMLRCVDALAGRKTPEWSRRAHDVVRRGHDVRRQAGALLELYRRLPRSA
jgi:glycosyltransferase involved in cell wall biosynthesis